MGSPVRAKVAAEGADSAARAGRPPVAGGPPFRQQAGRQDAAQEAALPRPAPPYLGQANDSLPRKPWRTCRVIFSKLLNKNLHKLTFLPTTPWIYQLINLIHQAQPINHISGLQGVIILLTSILSTH